MAFLGESVPDDRSLYSALYISIVGILPMSDLQYTESLESNDFSSQVYTTFILQWGLKSITFSAMAKWAGPPSRNPEGLSSPCRLKQMLTVFYFIPHGHEKS